MAKKKKVKKSINKRKNKKKVLNKKSRRKISKHSNEKELIYKTKKELNSLKINMDSFTLLPVVAVMGLILN